MNYEKATIEERSLHLHRGPQCQENIHGIRFEDVRFTHRTFSDDEAVFELLYPSSQVTTFPSWFLLNSFDGYTTEMSLNQ